MLVQIYGFTTAEDMHAVAGLDLDHVGIVLDEGYDVWDSVDLDTALEIIDAVPPTTTFVALSLHTEPQLIVGTLDALRPAIVHLGRAEEIPSETLANLRSQIAPVRVMSTVGVRDTTAIEEATRLARYSDYLLLDTAHPQTGVVGATGIVHDWAISREVSAAVDIPVILAGGLGPKNVEAAIRAVRPAGVDSETRTSRDDNRRRKDRDRVRAFADIARALP